MRLRETGPLQGCQDQESRTRSSGACCCALFSRSCLFHPENNVLGKGSAGRVFHNVVAVDERVSTGSGEAECRQSVCLDLSAHIMRRIAAPSDSIARLSTTADMETTASTPRGGPRRTACMWRMRDLFIIISQANEEAGGWQCESRLARRSGRTTH